MAGCGCGLGVGGVSTGGSDSMAGTASVVGIGAVCVDVVETVSSISEGASSSNPLLACTSCSTVGRVVPNCSKFCKASRAALRKRSLGELANL